VRKGIAAGIYGVANDIMTDSQKQVPFRQGILHGSRYVAIPTVRGHRVSTELGYGGAAKAYAVVQHEDLSLTHGHGNAKYLENPFNAAAPTAGAEVAKRAKLALEQNVTSRPSSTFPEKPE
jgi:hypothetical protein